MEEAGQQKSISKKYSFDEYKLYYESTEKVTDRRLENNKWNYSICIGIVLAIAYIWNWSISASTYAFIGLTITSILSFMASLFSSLWIGQIRDFKSLNNAKFEVLNNATHNLAFDVQSSGINFVSFNPFSEEWKKIEVLRALQEEQSYNIIALKSSNMEFFIPKAFRVIFILIFVISIVSIFLHPNLFIDSWNKFLLL